MNQPIEKQIGGDHYKRLGDYQPWIVCRKWFSEEEFIGAIKKDAIAYLCREKHKGGIEDIKKALHTLEIGLYLLEDRKCKTCQTNLLQDTDGFFCPNCEDSFIEQPKIYGMQHEGKLDKLRQS